MDGVFRNLPFVRVYPYDVVILLESLEVHVDHLLQVFELIACSGLVEACKVFLRIMTDPAIGARYRKRGH